MSIEIEAIQATTTPEAKKSHTRPTEALAIEALKVCVEHPVSGEVCGVNYEVVETKFIDEEGATLQPAVKIEYLDLVNKVKESLSRVVKTEAEQSRQFDTNIVSLLNEITQSLDIEGAPHNLQLLIEPNGDAGPTTPWLPGFLLQQEKHQELADQGAIPGASDERAAWSVAFITPDGFVKEPFYSDENYRWWKSHLS